MKIKILNGILIIDILSILFVVSIILIPATAARIILGIPFLLFFPGYTLVTALFVNNERINGIQRIALSFGMSIAVVGLIGFGLNYTAWGIRLEPVLYSITGFIIVFSVFALIREARAIKTNRLVVEYNLNLPGWGGSALNKSLSVILLIAIFGAFGVLGYTVAMPKTGEKFSEFYVLGLNDEAQDYPTEYVIQSGRITRVTYNNGTTDTTSGMGKVTLGIVNHEQKLVDYFVKMTINSDPVNINFNGIPVDKLGPIELQQGEEWEQGIGIVPQHAGDNQKVEFSLYKGLENAPEDSLHIWINVR